MELNKVNKLVYSLVLVLVLVGLVGCGQVSNSDINDSISSEQDIEKLKTNAELTGEKFVSQVNENEDIYHFTSSSYRYDEDTNTLHCEGIINEVMLLRYAFGDVLSNDKKEITETWKKDVSLLAKLPKTQLEQLGQSSTKVMFTIYTTTEKIYLRAIDGVIKDEANFDIFGLECTEEEIKSGANPICISAK